MRSKEDLLAILAALEVGYFDISERRGRTPLVEYTDDDKELLEECQKTWKGGVTVVDEYRLNALTRSRGKYIWTLFDEKAYLFSKDIEPRLTGVRHGKCMEVIEWYEDHRHFQSR